VDWDSETLMLKRRGKPVRVTPSEFFSLSYREVSFTYAPEATLRLCEPPLDVLS
jgi:hypothetical protein